MVVFGVTFPYPLDQNTERAKILTWRMFVFVDLLSGYEMGTEIIVNTLETIESCNSKCQFGPLGKTFGYQVTRYLFVVHQN